MYLDCNINDQVIKGDVLYILSYKFSPIHCIKYTYLFSNKFWHCNSAYVVSFSHKTIKLLQMRFSVVILCNGALEIQPASEEPHNMQ